MALGGSALCPAIAVACGLSIRRPRLANDENDVDEASLKIRQLVHRTPSLEEQVVYLEEAQEALQGATGQTERDVFPRLQKIEERVRELELLLKEKIVITVHHKPFIVNEPPKKRKKKGLGPIPL